jgi:hypothetical protein
MARTSKTPPPKARASRKAAGGSAAKKQPAARTRARAMERGPSKTRAVSEARPIPKERTLSRKRTSSGPASQNWAGLLNALVTTSHGREVLADALAAAAEALRRSRGTPQSAADEGLQQAAQAGAAALDAGTATLRAGADVAQATVDTAQSAARAVADMAADTASAMLPGSTVAETKRRGGGSGRRKRT